MSLSKDLTGVGLPPEQALRLGAELLVVNAAGTAQGTATQIKGSGNLFAIVTPAASQQGVQLPATAEINSEVVVIPTLATPLITVYPSTGQSIDLLAANAGLAFTTANKNARFVKTTPTNWRSFVSGAA